MLRLIPTQNASTTFQYLTQLDTISRMAESLSQSIRENFGWSEQVEQDASVGLFSALRSAFILLEREAQQEYWTSQELHTLLQNNVQVPWREAFETLFRHEIPVHEAMHFITLIREIVFQELENGSLTELNIFHLLTLLFDWVSEIVFLTWEGKKGQKDRVLTFGSLEIDDLPKIVESVRSPVDLQPVFQLIVDRVRNSQIWPMVAIGMTDQDDQEILIPAQAGFQEGYPKNIKFPAQGSATLETILRKEPIAVSDVSQNTEFPVLQEAARAGGYQSILLVPITVEEIKAVVTFGTPEPHEFSKEEILLANAIAQQVMIAIENARHYEREKQRVEQLESLNRLIAEKNHLLQRSAHIHAALTNLVLSNAGIDGILHAVRELLGNPVAIEDEKFQLLSYSADREYSDPHRLTSIASGGTAPEVFSNPQTATILEELLRNHRSVLIPAMPAIGMEKRRIVSPIIASGEILGYVWVMESLHPFDDLDMITAEQAALVVALEMVKQKASMETEMRLKADFIDDLLTKTGVKDSSLAQKASYLGYHLNKPSLILVVHGEGAGWELPDPRGGISINPQLIKRAQETIADFSDESIVSSYEGEVFIALHTPKSHVNVEKYLKTVCDEVREGLKRMNPNLQIAIGIGEPGNDISSIRFAYTQASRAIQAGLKLGRKNDTLRLEDLGIYGILYQESGEGELRAFSENTLASLLHYDQENGTELIKTLEAYLTYQGKLTEVARNLYIHVNTLRQRLERMEDVLEKDLSDPFTRLNLQIALRIYEITGTEPVENKQKAISKK